MRLLSEHIATLSNVRLRLIGSFLLIHGGGVHSDM
jgi:hypothetical protein